jgi:predicted N-acyltransferase
MDFEHKVRKNVNRARRDGVEVAIEHGDDALEAFMNIYTQTMLRRDAPKGFHFTPRFYTNLLSALNPMIKIFIARQRDRPVSVELVLHSNRHAYSFLGGTLEPDFPSRPNDLLKFELFRWARAEGLSDVVLGGGPIPEDGIYRYKKSFAPTGMSPFFAGEKVFDPATYDALIEQRRGFESIRGDSWTPIDDFFPAYRSGE